MWRTLAARGTQGRYDSHSVAIGLMQAMIACEDRIYNGKKLTNMSYSGDLELFCANLAMTSPRAYRLLRSELRIPHIRTLQSVLSLFFLDCRLMPLQEEAELEGSIPSRNRRLTIGRTQEMAHRSRISLGTNRCVGG
jgi:hypothetical protein